MQSLRQKLNLARNVGFHKVLGQLDPLVVVDLIEKSAHKMNDSFEPMRRPPVFLSSLSLADAMGMNFPKIFKFGF